MSANPKTIAILVAAGSGTRMGGLPKQYRLLGGMPVLRHSLLRLAEARGQIGVVQVVIQPGHELLYEQAVDSLPQELILKPVLGGKTRQESVLNALRAIARHQPQQALIHDAARPFLTQQLIADALAALAGAKGAACAVKVGDTLKRAASGTISETVPRENLFAAQTPQAFDYQALMAAHIEAAKIGRFDFTDDAALLEWQGQKVTLVDGAQDNFKLTEAEDFIRAEKAFAGTSRSALGYDVHAFQPGDHVMLGGVKVPSKFSVRAHSDGDVILHALTDAMLGLASKGDIGQHFPPSDPQWKNANSKIFVSKALELLRESGGTLAHCDVTLIAQEPKISPVREKIVNSLADMLALPASNIGFKATTSEGLGFIGRNEGIAAYVMITAKFS